MAGVRSMSAQVLVARFLQMMLQLFLRLPPALPYGPHLACSRGNVRMLVRADIPRVPLIALAHKGMVPPGVPAGKSRTAAELLDH